MNAVLLKRTVVLFLLVGAAFLYAQPSQQGATVEQPFSPTLSPHFAQIGDFNLHYLATEAAAKPILVFIHGTPGSARSMRRVMNDSRLQAQTRLISIDRPGWGESQLPDGRRSEPDFDAQIALIVPLLERVKQESGGQPLLLVGHSYGGSIAPYIAFRHPGLVDGVLMAASAIDPELGKPRWYNRAASTWLVSQFLRDALLKANDEIWGVSPALERLRPWWQDAPIPLIFVQGEEDELVDPRNLDFAAAELPPGSEVLRLPDQGHLLQVQRPDLLAELCLQLLQRVQVTQLLVTR